VPSLEVELLVLTDSGYSVGGILSSGNVEIRS
jgi:hypothetical protein